MTAYRGTKRRATKKKTKAKKRVRSFTRESKKRRVAKRPTVGKKPVAKRPSAAKKAKTKRSKAPVKKGSRGKKVVRGKKPQAAKQKRPVRPVSRKPSKKPASALEKAKALQRELDKLRRENEKLRTKVQKGKKTRKDQKAKQRETRREARKLAREREKEQLREFGAPQVEETRKVNKRELKKRFSELEKLAKKAKQLPKADPRRRKINTRRTLGEQRIVRVERFVDEDEVEQILYDVEKATRSMKKAWPIWMAAVIFSAMSDGQLFGSNMRVLIANHPDAANFQVQGVENTGATHSLDGMILKLEHELDKLVDERSLVKVLYVRVMNFAYKPKQ